MKLSKDVLEANPGLDLRAFTSARGKVWEDCADTLLSHLHMLAPDLPAPERDRPFNPFATARPFKIDLAYPPAMVAVEVNGGLKRAGGGKHATSRDHTKVRELVLAGWRVLVFTSSEVRHDPLMCVAYIRSALTTFAPAVAIPLAPPPQQLDPREE